MSLRITIILTALLLLPLALVPAIAANTPELVLSEDEKAWLEAHPVIRIAVDPNSPPFEWISENNEYRGISADLLQLIEQKLNIQFESVIARDWAHVLELARTREADLLSSVVQSPDRESFLAFTQPYLSLPGVIISAREFKSISDLEGHKVAVVSGGIWDERISEHDDKVSIIRVEDTRTAVDLTALGGVDAMVSNLASITYLIGKEGITNLQIVGRVEQQLDLSLGVRSDWPELVPILNKALDSIPPEQIEAIKNKWVSIDKLGFQFSPLFWALSLGTLMFMVFVFTAVIIWNRSLKRMVEIRSNELEQTRHQLAHAEKMESVAKLALGVAHEVKNPLAIIQMGVDFLGHGDNRDEQELAVLKDMSEAVHRSDSIIQSLQIFSRQKAFELQQYNLNEVIEQALELLKPELEAHHIKLIRNLDPDIQDMPMDARQLQQAVVNIARNAAQAMPAGGDLYIATSEHFGETKEQAGQPSRFCRIEIHDSGTGIEEEHLPRIFDPFFTTRPQGEGTGLGLSVSQNIVKLHNGSIEVSNRPQGGVSV
ncbi:MAG: transporter substrate-binding domain-containing protein, partial [Gammaproteobacteria bacterium]|nr:transporter substrate-binding domain-containing protein [Gammaproteobacteria bacterium]